MPDIGVCIAIAAAAILVSVDVFCVVKLARSAKQFSPEHNNARRAVMTILKKALKDADYREVRELQPNGGETYRAWQDQATLWTLPKTYLECTHVQPDGLAVVTLYTFSMTSALVRVDSHIDPKSGLGAPLDARHSVMTTRRRTPVQIDLQMYAKKLHVLV